MQPKKRHQTTATERILSAAAALLAAIIKNGVKGEMMNISEMSDQEKSVMLARLCGWTLVRREWKGALKLGWHNNENELLASPCSVDLSLWGEDLESMTCPNLYYPTNMALAWRVSNFIYSEFFNGEDWCDGYFTWWHEVDWYKYTPAAAQRAWLDKILELAIEAGMVK